MRHSMRIRRQHSLFASSLAVLLTAAASIGCGGGGPPAKDASGEVVKTSTGATVSKAAADKFNQGLQQMARCNSSFDRQHHIVGLT